MAIVTDYLERTDKSRQDNYFLVRPFTLKPKLAQAVSIYSKIKEYYLYFEKDIDAKFVSVPKDASGYFRHMMKIYCNVKNIENDIEVDEVRLEKYERFLISSCLYDLYTRNSKKYNSDSNSVFYFSYYYTFLELLILTLLKNETVELFYDMPYEFKPGIEDIKISNKKRDFELFLKWIFAYGIDIEIYKIFQWYKYKMVNGIFNENIALEFIEKNSSFQDQKKLFDFFNSSKVYEVDGISFFKVKKILEEKELPIFYICSFMKNNFGVDEFEVLNALQSLSKEGSIEIKKGAAKILCSKALPFGKKFLPEYTEMISSHSWHANIENFFLSLSGREIKLSCPSCGSSVLNLTNQVRCSKCNFVLGKLYGSYKLFGYELVVLLSKGRVRVFYENRRPILLKLKYIKNGFWKCQKQKNV